MRFIATGIDGAWEIHPEAREDERGRFLRAWCVREFAAQGIDFSPVQANMGFSVQAGTLRGMHLQVAPALEAKLVRCTRGSIFDVVLDLRPESSSYGRWHGVRLSAENARMLFVPERCAHGYQTLEADAEMHYLTSAFYAPEAARGVRHDDPAFRIRWPRTVTVISEQDRNWPLLRGPFGE
jgi:dTDP-4-dehydrorhamnose 3,5-epimerase